MAKKRWQDLSPQTRAVIAAGALVDAALKGLALKDLWKRPVAEIRGPKWLWGAVVALSNSFGVVPLVYLVYGRRKQQDPVAASED